MDATDPMAVRTAFWMARRKERSMRLPLLLAIASFSPEAQAPAEEARPFRVLRDSVAPRAAVEGVLALRVRWSAATSASGPASPLSLIEQAVRSGRPRRERRPELAPDRLVVVLEDGGGRELDFTLVADPRVVRAERPGPDGAWTGSVHERSDAELFVTVPDIPGAEL